MIKIKMSVYSIEKVNKMMEVWKDKITIDEVVISCNTKDSDELREIYEQAYKGKPIKTIELKKGETL